MGQTPLVKLQRLGQGLNNNTILCKLEGNNPAGSVKDRWAARARSPRLSLPVCRPNELVQDTAQACFATANATASSRVKVQVQVPST